MAVAKIYCIRQLRDTEVDRTRKAMAAKQGWKCPLCGGSLAFGVNALDHDHKTGSVRAVLCRSCNVSEGKVLAGVKYRTPFANLAYKDPVKWLRNLADYWEHHSANPSGIIHPTFDVAKGKQKPVKRVATKATKPTKTGKPVKKTPKCF